MTSSARDLSLPRPADFSFPVSLEPLLFSLKTFAGAMLALGASWLLEVTDPQWSVITAYIVSQPLLGAIWAKGAFRLVGTLGGASGCRALCRAVRAGRTAVHPRHGAVARRLRLWRDAGAQLRVLRLLAGRLHCAADRLRIGRSARRRSGPWRSTARPRWRSASSASASSMRSSCRALPATRCAARSLDLRVDGALCRRHPAAGHAENVSSPPSVGRWRAK